MRIFVHIILCVYIFMCVCVCVGRYSALFLLFPLFFNDFKGLKTKLKANNCFARLVFKLI